MEAKNGAATPSVDPADFSLKGHDPESENKKRTDDLVALSRVSAAISGLRELEAILRVGLNSVLDIMDGAVGGIMLLTYILEILSESFLLQGILFLLEILLLMIIGWNIGKILLETDVITEDSRKLPTIIESSDEDQINTIEAEQ